MCSSSREDSEIVQLVAERTGLPFGVTDRLVDACINAIEDFLTDDNALVSPPLSIGQRDDPVFVMLTQRLATCTDAEFNTWQDKNDDDLAAWLGVSVQQLQRHPVATDLDVLEAAPEELGWRLEEVQDGGLTAGQEALAQLERVLPTWLHTFKNRRYRHILPAGREDEFEAWLEQPQQLCMLAEFGYPVDSTPGSYWRQRYLNGRAARPDLVCRFSAATDRARAGDWLVIENKTGRATHEGVEQVAGYVELLRTELAAAGEQVFGLLIADTAPNDVRDHLARLRIGFVSLSELGYRRRS